MPDPIAFDPIDPFVESWTAAGFGAELQMTAMAAVMRAQRVLTIRNEATLRSFGLNRARYDVLIMTLFRPGTSVPMSRLSGWLMVHPTSVTNTVDRLEEQGLVRRVPHPSDRRALVVELTDAGRDLGTRVAKALAEESFGLAGIAEDDLRELVDLLRRIRRDAGEFDDGDPSLG